MNNNNGIGKSERRKCFIIMPISDSKEYTIGHFSRVYEYIIKPACILAGFIPIRADDVKTTNLIALDIVKQIIESDMAICDLSSRNPNVLYEVGIRQAFNRPVTFIKDFRTERIFDIQGFRDVGYDETLRIDTVEQAILELSETMQNTFENQNEINSLVSLLGIEPAKISTTKISHETELVLSTLQQIGNRLSNLENRRPGVIENTNEGGATTLPEVNLDSLTLLTTSELAEIKVGSIVTHPRFGKGKVISKKGPDWDRLVIIIQFEVAGLKQLMAKFVKLYS